jgi:hypothetical protein
MDLIPPPSPTGKRQKRVDCVYSPEERTVIEIYKEEYRNQINRKGRFQIYRTKILPAIYTYWQEIGELPETEIKSRQCAKVNVIL